MVRVDRCDATHKVGYRSGATATSNVIVRSSIREYAGRARRHVVEVPAIGGGETLVQPHSRPPAERAETRYVEKLARGPVGAIGIEPQPSLEPDRHAYFFGQLGDGNVCAAADIDRRLVAV